MADILGTKVREAYSKAIAGEANDAEWLMLLMDRQCKKLDAIHGDVRDVRNKVDVFYEDRARAKRWAGYLFGGFGLISVGLGVAIRELLARKL